MKQILTTLLLTAMTAASAQAYCGDAHDKAFNQTVKRTFKAIKEQDSGTLLFIFNRDKVTIGPERTAVAYADLQRQFADKSGDYYCDIFVCQAQPGLMNRLFNGISVSKSMSYNFGKAEGIVRISNGSVASEIELRYSLNGACEWQLDSLYHR
ncbi:hypothetical protein [Asticcacaulis sp. YBE204]|uniref:hypothetical protein n=1 Tax=Asticcacaulis sp. YBE204 TaxID=1282363 RepID=UPI0003C3E287|nr:hypothetical protein [Asticcacaulis sp. YBE204]ESQ77479.1 hypothetical protein AEYBE204_17215 [Asticcacaulis sp. YBE204]